MRINSINSSYMPAARNLYSSRQNKQNINMTAPNSLQFEGNKDNNGEKSLRKAAQISTGALLASMVLGGGGMTSCDDFDEIRNSYIKIPVDTVEKYIPIVQDPDTIFQVKTDTVEVPVIIPGKDSIIYRDSIIHDTDTIYHTDTIKVPIIIPGKDSIIYRDSIIRDTINQIITKRDTIWMKEEYASPVAPIIKKFYNVLNINPGNGKIPVKMVWTDEKDGSFNKSIFDGRSSSINQMTFNITKTPFDENAGGVVLGQNEEFYRLKFSKVNDNSLSLIFEKPRIEGKPEDGRDDQWRPVEYYIYDIGSGEVQRYTLKDDNSLEDRGQFLPGDMPSSIILRNPYGNQYRYSSLSVKSTDAPSKTEDYED